MFSEKMDRSKILIGNHEHMAQLDDEYWSNASLEEKLGTVIFLRECFYGNEATTGRIQRIYTVSKLKQS